MNPQIIIRKWNNIRGCYEIVFEADDDGTYSMPTGFLDISGQPTFTGQIVEGDVQTIMGVLKKKGTIIYEKKMMKFSINFEDFDELWGRNLPVNNIKIIGDVRINPEVLGKTKE